jgi:hypothetical protein
MFNSVSNFLGTAFTMNVHLVNGNKHAIIFLYTCISSGLLLAFNLGTFFLLEMKSN